MIKTIKTATLSYCSPIIANELSFFLSSSPWTIARQQDNGKFLVLLLLLCYIS